MSRPGHHCSRKPRPGGRDVTLTLRTRQGEAEGLNPVVFGEEGQQSANVRKGTNLTEFQLPGHAGIT